MPARSLVLLSALCFATTGTAQALGPSASPAAVGAARIAVGALLLAIVARRVVPEARRRTTWPVRPVLVGAVGVAGYQLCFFGAVSSTGVAVGTVVALGSGPVFTGLLARVFTAEPLTARWMTATTTAVAGVAVLVASGASAHVQPTGVLLALGAGLSYATYTVVARSLLTDREPEAVMARLFGVGALLLLPVLPIAGAGWLTSPGGIALALYLGAIPTALAYVLFARGLRHLPAGEVATLTLLEPLTAAGLGAVVLGEHPGAGALAGVALVLAGLLVLATGRQPEPGAALAPA